MIGVTLVSVCVTDSLGRSTLVTLCVVLSVFGTAVISVASGPLFCAVRWKISSSVFSDSIFLFPRGTKGAMGERWKISLTMSAVIVDSLLDEEVDGIFTWQGGI